VPGRVAPGAVQALWGGDARPGGGGGGPGPRLDADALDLLEDLVEPVGRAARAELVVERGHEPDRDLSLRGSDGEVRAKRRDGRVAHVVVDELGGSPDRI